MDAILRSTLPRSSAGRERWKRLFRKWRRWHAQNPVLMIFEDAHWTDPTSLEVFGRVVDRIATLRVLLIVTFRPEFEPPWIGRPHVTALTINRLAQREIDAMIDRVVGNKRAAGEHPAGHHRAHRRHPAVRGGDDEGGAGGGERGRGAATAAAVPSSGLGGPREPARIA